MDPKLLLFIALFNVQDWMLSPFSQTHQLTYEIVTILVKRPAAHIPAACSLYRNHTQIRLRSIDISTVCTKGYSSKRKKKTEKRKKEKRNEFD